MKWKDAQLIVENHGPLISGNSLGTTHFSQIITGSCMFQGKGAGKSTTRVCWDIKLGWYKRQPPPKFENLTPGSSPPQKPTLSCNSWPLLPTAATWKLLTKCQWSHHFHVQPQSYGTEVLWRWITTAATTKKSPVLIIFAKWDIKNGVWHLVVSDKDAWIFVIFYLS